MGAHVRQRYGDPPPRVSASGCSRGDSRAARILNCSEQHAKDLRLGGVADRITAILTGHADDPEKLENFRRQCWTALSLETAPSLTPELVVDAATADAREDASRTAALVYPDDPAKQAAYDRDLRAEVAAKLEVLRAREAH